MVLPIETILEILEHSSKNTITTVMRTNRAMHGIGTRALYTAVDVQDLSARLFFTTIASRTTLSDFYSHFVKRLTFSAIGYGDKFIVFPIFCETLLCLQNLQYLSITTCTGDGDWMRLCMKRFGIIRESESTLSIARTPVAQRTLYTRLTLPSLKTLRIGGDVASIDIARHRRVSEVSFTTPLNYEEVDQLLVVLGSTLMKTSLESLSIRLLPEVDLEPVLWALSESIPKLHTLTVEQPLLNSLVSTRHSNLETV